MKLQIAGIDTSPEVIMSLKLEQNGNEISVVTGENGWSLITFRVKDGELVFARNSGIEDDTISTDNEGNIVEVDE